MIVNEKTFSQREKKFYFSLLYTSRTILLDDEKEKQNQVIYRMCMWSNLQ